MKIDYTEAPTKSGGYFMELSVNVEGSDYRQQLHTKAEALKFAHEPKRHLDTQRDYLTHSVVSHIAQALLPRVRNAIKDSLK